MKKIIAFFHGLFAKKATTSKQLNWKVSVHDYEGYPLFLRYPSNLNYDQLQTLYPVLLVATLDLEAVTTNGLPESDYNESLMKCDSFIVNYFKDQSQGHCVLIETYNGKRIFYTYVSETATVKLFKEMLDKNFINHKIEFEFKLDKTLSFIRNYFNGISKTASSSPEI